MKEELKQLGIKVIPKILKSQEYHCGNSNWHDTKMRKLQIPEVSQTCCVFTLIENRYGKQNTSNCIGGENKEQVDPIRSHT